MSKYELEDDYDYDFNVLGISGHEKDYRMCWAINQILGITMQKEEKDIEVIIKKSSRYSLHTMFTAIDYDNEIDYRLIANRSTMGFLIPEKPQADYIFIASDHFQLDFQQMNQKIKLIPFVLTTFEIDLETLKSKENLVF
jgi:hypothetical protein